MSGGFHIPIDVIREDFTAKWLESFLDQYLPGGAYEGNEFVVGGVDGGAGRSMAVHLRGAKRGVWKDWAGAPDHCGDAIDLVRHVLFGGNKASAIQWMIGYCGLAETGHEAIAQKRAQARERNRKKREEAERDAAQKRARAWHIWKSEASPDLRGTPVERYFSGRGIVLGLLPSTGALRYHPALYNSESKRRWPALVSLVVNGEGSPIAIHRIWLEPKPDGSCGKAPLADPKKALGLFKGGYISICKGAGDKTLRDAQPGEHVMIAEGIEDCATAAMAFPEARIMCAISLDNLANVPVPAQCGRLTIIGDNDEGEAQRAKLNQAALAQMRRGVRDVRIALAAGHKDINALHQAAQGGRQG